MNTTTTPRRQSLRDSDEDLLSVFSFLAQPEIAAPTPQDINLSNTLTATLAVNTGIHSSYESLAAATSEIAEAIPKSRRTILSINTSDHNHHQEIYSPSPRSGAPSPSHYSSSADRFNDRQSVASHSSVNSNASSSSTGTIHHERKSGFTHVSNSTANSSDRASAAGPRLTGHSTGSSASESQKLSSSHTSGSTSHDSFHLGVTQVARFPRAEKSAATGSGKVASQNQQKSSSSSRQQSSSNAPPASSTTTSTDLNRSQAVQSPMSVSTTTTTTGLPAGVSERKSMLLMAPQTLQQSVNSGDFEKLRDFVYDACHDDCTFQSSSMTSEVHGKQRFLEFFWSLTQACPDFLLVINRTQYNASKNVVIAMMESSGCKLFSNQSEYLFNTLRFGPPDCVDPQLKERALEIENSGKHYKFVTDIVMLLFLNAECTKIQHVRMTLSVTGISVSSD
jgi:hypothetical protein